MQSRPLGLDTIAVALTDGWQLANATRGTSITYAAIFTLIGAVILGLLLSQGFTPFVLAAAGAFMLVGPAILAGFFGIAQAHEAGRKAGVTTTEETDTPNPALVKANRQSRLSAAAGTKAGVTTAEEAASGQSGFGEGSRERGERYAGTKAGVTTTEETDTPNPALVKANRQGRLSAAAGTKAGVTTAEEAASGQSGFGEGSRERGERYAGTKAGAITTDETDTPNPALVKANRQGRLSAAAGTKAGVGATVKGFAAASNAIWVIALISALLFMIFVTDAAILYSYMVGGTPVWLTELIPATAGVVDFLFWGAVSGFVIAFLLFCISAFSVPLLCERRATLVNAVVASVRVVFGNFLPAMTWAALLSGLIIGSILLLPLLPLTLPWLAYASRALYRQVFP